MTLDVGQLALLGLLSTALHWLVARSKIAEPLWSRARGWFAALLACPACSGWWLGLGLGLGGVRPASGQGRVVAVIVSGLLALVLTPIFESVLLWGLEHSAIGADADATDPDGVE